MVLKMKNDNVVILLFFLWAFVVSCGTYKPNELINKGEELLVTNKGELERIAILANNLASDSCTMYQISTSNETDYFMFSEYNFNQKENKVEQGNLITCSEANKSEILNSKVKNITDINFVKNLYVSFVLDPYRNHSGNNAKLIYCFDKTKFQKLFPNYIFLNNKNSINENSAWVYFYDENWGITVSSTYYKKSKEECLQMIK